MPHTHHHPIPVKNMYDFDEVSIEDLQGQNLHFRAGQHHVKTKSHLKTIQRLKEKLKNKNN